MPIFDRFQYQDCSILVWKIEESLEELKDAFSYYTEEKIDLSYIKKDDMRIQKMASRLVSATLFGENGLDYDDIEKDEVGKPRITNCDYHFSVSHTDGWAAAIIGLSAVGIDVELFTPKIERIKNKFCNQVELTQNGELKDLVRIWGAKESMYKAYGKRKVLFAEEMAVDDKKGVLKKNGITHHFDVHSKIYEDEIVLVFAKELYRE